MIVAQTLELNRDFLRAMDLLENGTDPVFITGKAGTGKSTLLQYFRDHTTKRVAVLAPTGVAAINVGGQTVHSFFRFKPDVTPEMIATMRLRRDTAEMYRHLDAVIIDEVSMLRADLLDCVDRFLRRFGPRTALPFGGVQMIFIGDLFQLPPVVNRDEDSAFREAYRGPYFFCARVMEEISLRFIDLEKIYRQHDDEFIGLLNAIRHDRLTPKLLERLNARYQSDIHSLPDEFVVYLSTTNAVADRINAEQLRRIPGEPFCLQGTIDGRFDERVLPTKQFLDLKTHAQVMLLNNDPEDQWVNGSLGRIVSVGEDLSQTAMIAVELDDGRTVEVGPFTWEMYRFSYNQGTRQLESETVGSFQQYPLKLAWAVTIHKSQGKTFDKVILDIGSGAFAHGQTYVALSRCRTLEGITLRRPISRRDIIVDPQVVEFMSGLEQNAGG